MSGVALLVAAALGLGLWLMVSQIPVLRRPRLMYRVAPYVLQVSSGARDLVGRRTVDPSGLLLAAFSPIIDRLAPLSQRAAFGDAGLARLLRQSRSQLSATSFRLRQLQLLALAAVAGAVLGVVATAFGAATSSMLGVTVAAPMLAFVISEWLLRHRASKRMARIWSELPTVLEFLTLSLSAGEGLHDALRRVGGIGSGALADELRTIVADTGAGTTLADALQRCSNELEHPGFIRCVEQMRGALERGTPLATTLRAQAADARDAARRQLMEAAGRKEIGMLVPLVFGVLPITVVFALWPGVYVLQTGF